MVVVVAVVIAVVVVVVVVVLVVVVVVAVLVLVVVAVVVVVVVNGSGRRHLPRAIAPQTLDVLFVIYLVWYFFCRDSSTEKDEEARENT